MNATTAAELAPKPLGKSPEPGKKSPKLSEAEIQAEVEDYLIQRGIPFFRLPDLLFKILFRWLPSHLQWLAANLWKLRFQRSNSSESGPHPLGSGSDASTLKASEDWGRSPKYGKTPPPSPSSFGWIWDALRDLGEWLRDWPDLLVVRMVPGIPWPMLLPLELKTCSGKASRGQRRTLNEMNGKIARSPQEAIAIIEEFMAWNPRPQPSPGDRDHE